MNKKFSLSVIIPAYNAEKYICTSVESVCKSYYQKMEIIIVNDGSTDNTEEIIKQLSDKDRRIKYVTQSNSGLSAARNKGMSMATGEYVLFLDSDDWLDVDYISEGMKICNETSTDVLLTDYVKEYGAKSVVVNLLGRERKTLTAKEVKKQIFQRLFGPLEKMNPLTLEIYNTAWGKFYRREIIKDIKFSPRAEVGLAEDLYFNIQVFSGVLSVEYSPYILLHYNRSNGNSLVSRYNHNNEEQVRNLHYLLNEKIQQYNLEDDFKTALKNRIVLSVFSQIIQATRHPDGWISAMKEIEKLLDSDVYMKVKNDVDYNKFSNIVWKTFFLLAKNKYAIVLFVIVKLATTFQKYRNG